MWNNPTRSNFLESTHDSHTETNPYAATSRTKIKGRTYLSFFFFVLNPTFIVSAAPARIIIQTNGTHIQSPSDINNQESTIPAPISNNATKQVIKFRISTILTQFHRQLSLYFLTNV